MKRSNRCMLFWGIAATSLLCACSQSPIEKPSDAQSPAEKPSDALSPIEPQLAPSVPTNPTDDAKQRGDAENEETGAAVVKQTKPVTPCKDGGSYQAGSCLCGEMTNAPDVASQWVCFGDFLRCLRPEGCAYQGMIYPTFTEIRPDGAYCGEDRVPEKLDGFVCTHDVNWRLYMLSADIESNGKESKLGLWRFTGLIECALDLSPQREYWQCGQDECDCHGVKIEKSDVCMDTNVRAMFASTNPFNTDSKICKAIPTFINSDDNDCKGMIYPAKSHRFDYDCNGGRWVCMGKDCECPVKIQNDTIQYKTIHLGDICDMKPIARALKIPMPENKNNINGTKCKNGKCICESQVGEYNYEKADPLMNNPKCYCGKTIIYPSGNWGQGGCYWGHVEELTLYCLKDAAVFSDKDEFDSNTELYTIKFIWNVDESDCGEEDEDNEDEDSEDEDQINGDEDEDTQQLDENKSDNNASSVDESVPQAEDVLSANDSGEQTPTIVANTISEPDNIKRDIYEDIRFWYDDKYQICMS